MSITALCTLKYVFIGSLLSLPKPLDTASSALPASSLSHLLTCLAACSPSMPSSSVAPYCLGPAWLFPPKLLPSTYKTKNLSGMCSGELAFRLSMLFLPPPRNSPDYPRKPWSSCAWNVTSRKMRLQLGDPFLSPSLPEFSSSFFEPSPFL